MVIQFPYDQYNRHLEAVAIRDDDYDGLLPHAFDLLFAAVRAASKTASIGFIFHGLEATLRNLEPLVMNREGSLRFPKEKAVELAELMREGEAIVGKCLRRSHLVCWNKQHYAKKFRKLEDAIIRSFQVYMALRICRDSKELLLEVKDLDMAMRKLNDFAREKVQNNNVKWSLSLGSCEVPKEPDFIVGLDESFHQLKGWLLDGGISRRVISAPKGFGKTNLVKKLGHDSDIEGKFKNIFFINVSKSWDFIMMVRRMIQSHHKSMETPVIETQSDAVFQLQQLLSRIGSSPILLILDDVPSEAEALLEKFMFDQVHDYKILATSRFEFPKFGTTHQLSRLNHEAAQKLFLHSATPRFGNQTVLNEDLTEKMLELCNGSPLSLTVVGKAVCGKHPSIWRSLLLEWSEDPSLMVSAIGTFSTNQAG